MSHINLRPQALMFCNWSSRDCCGFSFLLRGCYGLEEIHYNQGCLDMQFLVQNLGCLKTHLLEAMRKTLYKFRRLLSLSYILFIETGWLCPSEHEPAQQWVKLEVPDFRSTFCNIHLLYLPSCVSASYLIEDHLFTLRGLKIDFHIRKFKGLFCMGCGFRHQYTTLLLSFVL